MLIEFFNYRFDDRHGLWMLKNTWTRAICIRSPLETSVMDDGTGNQTREAAISAIFKIEDARNCFILWL
jgi:hypothetical protein